MHVIDNYCNNSLTCIRGETQLESHGSHDIRVFSVVSRVFPWNGPWPVYLNNMRIKVILAPMHWLRLHLQMSTKVTRRNFILCRAIQSMFYVKHYRLYTVICCLSRYMFRNSEAHHYALNRPTYSREENIEWCSNIRPMPQTNFQKYCSIFFE